MDKFLLLSALLLLLTPTIANEGKNEEIGQRRFRIAPPECKPFPYAFFDSVPFLLDLLRWISSIFTTLIHTVYVVLNTVLITTCEIISSLFGFLRHVFKLVEYLGYVVRIILQVNYNFVSSVFTWLAKICEFVTFTFRYLAELIFSAIASVFQGILSVLRSLISSVLLGFGYIFDSAQNAKNATGLVLHQSYLGWKYILKLPTSALMNVTKSIAAILECLVATVWNSALLLVELLSTTIFFFFRGIAFLGNIFGANLASTWNHFVNIAKMLMCTLRDLIASVGNFFVWLFHTLISFITFLLLCVIQGFTVIFSTIGWSVKGALSFVLGAFKFFGTYIAEMLTNSYKGLCIITMYLAQSTPGGKYTLATFLTTAIVIFCSWFVFKINVLTYPFQLLEDSLHGVSALLMTSRGANDSANTRTNFGSNQSQPSNPPTDEKEIDLRRQLERERDKNLCVVCQTEQKNILVIPCRHMCMCKGCSNELLRIQRFQTRTCPLCRTRISSVIEIYS